MRVPLLAAFLVSSCVSARADGGISLHGTVATLIADNSLGFAMLDARMPLTSHLTGSAALVHLDPSGPREEQQVRLSLTASLPVAKYLFDDRVLWARSDSDVEYWRNRWRLFLPMGGRFSNARWVVFDELYYNDPRGFYRNVVATGVTFTPVSRVTSDVMYMYIDNRHTEVDHALLVMFSVRFNQ